MRKLTVSLSCLAMLIPAVAFAVPQSDEVRRSTVNVEIDGKSIRAQLSPNGDQVLWTENDGGGREIMIAKSDGTDAKKLTDNDFFDFEPEWNLEGDRIYFTSNRSGPYQIYSMSAKGDDVKQITDNEFGSRRPKFSSAGHFVWQVMHQRRGKANPTDIYLKLADGKEKKILAEKRSLPHHVWHPDGAILALGSIGSLQFINVETDEKTTISFRTMDERLISHNARDMQWSPDGERVACRVSFVGGRIGDTSIFGDDEVFVIERDGEFKIFEDLKTATESYDWITIK